jgi:integrase/recombinase XerD
MTARLTTTVNSIKSVPNPINAELIAANYEYMKNSDKSERYQNNNLKTIIYLAKSLAPDITFYDIQKKEQIIAFLDTKIKSKEADPDRRWITTWNDYLSRIKFFFRWLYNQRIKQEHGEYPISISEWKTPDFLKISKKTTKRISPYLETELWERDELLFIVKYEQYIRNKAALTLLWDLDARNHEVTSLKIKHILLRERYGEGEVPFESKTGTGPILLTCSFPYVRDWINEHPFKNEPNARLICNLLNGAPITPDNLWKIMMQLKNRIIRLIETGSITDDQEIQKLEYLLKTKRWNPYCIRHSAITADSDYLHGFALHKKVRWGMNSKQPARYIKRRMGPDVKNQILVHDGIISQEEIQKKPAVVICYRCNYVNATDTKFCSKCSYPLTPAAYEEIKASEKSEISLLRKELEPLLALKDKLFKHMASQMEARRR